MTQEEKHYEERLSEIAGTVFGVLSDDQVLALLAERKQLSDLKERYELVQKEQKELELAETEKASIEKEIERLNLLISPDKADDDLIHLIEERKGWEAKLSEAERVIATLKKGDVVEPAVPDKKEASVEVSSVVPSPVPKEEIKIEEPKAKPSIGSVDPDFGEEQIEDLELGEHHEFAKYLEHIKQEPNAIGRILEDLPTITKKDKLFMLAVAKIDPAYAMHYADETLKKDDDFNVKLAGMKNPRNSGSVLAEMLPEARTAKVVAAAVRQDYRNVRFVLPNMVGYDDMLERAKKGALEKVQAMKESVDPTLLIPKILQKDSAFMEKVKKIVPKA